MKNKVNEMKNAIEASTVNSIRWKKEFVIMQMNHLTLSSQRMTKNFNEEEWRKPK